MYQSQTRPNSGPENLFKKCDLCGSPNILGQPAGPQERSCRGVAMSLNRALNQLPLGGGILSQQQQAIEMLILPVRTS